MIYLILIFILFTIDLMIKFYIEAQNNDSFPRSLFQGKITLHKSHNAGMVMGFLKDFPKAVKLIPLCISCIVTIFYLPYYFKKGNLLLKTSGIFVISGALNNIFDRITRSYVVDYFSLPFKKIKHIIFNLSDMFIFLGSLLLLLHELLKSFRKS